MINILRIAVGSAMVLSASGAMAAAVAIDTSNPSNGLTRIYSTSFDGALAACSPGTTYCGWFAGDPTASNLIPFAPNPSGVNTNVPGGIGPTGAPVAPVPAAGSFLDLSLSGGNTLVTLAISSITFNNILITTAVAGGITTTAVNAGIVLNPTGPVNGGALTPAGGGSTGNTVAVNGSGQAVFQVQNAGNIVADFSRFSQVASAGCVGAGCPLVLFDALNLDMVRYVLEIDYDPTFTSFTGKFVGQTANSSLVFATLNSAPSVVPVPAAVWFMASGLGLLGAMRRKSQAA